MHPYVKLAHSAIETYLTSGNILEPPTNMSDDLLRPAAVFVTLHTQTGDLRGCRGTITPTEPTLATAIIKTAIASATNDPRFSPMMLPDIIGLQIKVDVLSELEKVTDITTLNEKIYGVVIQSDTRRAVLLPDIPLVKSVSHQLKLVRRKAGLQPEESAQLYRFTVKRYA